MGTSARQTGQSLKQVARALEKIPDDAVKEAAEAVVTDARARGGTFFGGRYRLGAKVKQDRSSVTVLGTPPGAWAIKSYGRSKSVARGRVLGVKGGTFHATTSKAVPRGDNRWTKVVERAEDESPRIIAEAVSKAMRV